MDYSKSAHKLRTMIDKAIEDSKITRSEMDMILHIATEDGSKGHKGLITDLLGQTMSTPYPVPRTPYPRAWIFTP